MTISRLNAKVLSENIVTVAHYADELKIEVETERLIIRPYTDKDFKHCLHLYGNRIGTRYFDHGEPRSAKEVVALIKEKAKKYSRQGEPFGLFSIFRKEDGVFLGQIDLIPGSERGVVEIGFILEPKYHNQGYCTEAVKAMLGDYIDELNRRKNLSGYLPVEETFATVHPDNFASKKVLEKVGMNFDKSEYRFGHSRLWYSFHHLGSYSFT
jgi:RimJ/RimL family protein N-acetyltransferase